MKRNVLTLICAVALSVCLGSGMALATESTATSSTTGGTTASTAAKPAPAKPKPVKVTWKKSKGYYYCYVNGKKQKGLKTIKGKTYSFTSKGAQRNGWLKIGDEYCYFRIQNGAKGYLLKSKVQNGISIDKYGHAKVNATAQAELNNLVKANSIVRSVSKPADSQKKKLRAAWNWMSYKCTETSSHTLRPGKGWHREYGYEILYYRHGACESMGVGFAYLAQSCGAKKAVAVASGGHGWCKVDGNVYDPEFSRTHSFDVYNVPRGQVTGAMPAYFSNEVYVSTIQPRTTPWSKAKPKKSVKKGLVKSKGSYYYYRNGKKVRSKWVAVGAKKYYFASSGKAITYSARIKGKYYVFTSKGRLLTGTKTRTVKVGKRTFQVTKAGLAKSGWNASKTKRFAKSGELMTGIWLDGSKLWWLSSKGAYSKDKTAALRKAAKQYGNAETLLKLMGKPSKVKRGLDICLLVPGHEDDDGTITKYTYGHVVIEVFADKTDGNEYLLNVLSR